ncbi:MAG: SDR family NAD(P)-dependent oxidoreductase [Woeseiaceae bacterium]|nr:SDR family NAD(P)-dependent oxidoreductase [Woeseiaceae bacterium]
MTALKTFRPQSRVAVIGASGGIGQALVALFANDPQVERVFALSRTPCPVSSQKITLGALDLEHEASIANCAASLSSDFPLDIVVVATGILWSGEQLRPEKNMRELDMNKLAKVFAINVTGPALVAKHFLPTLRKDSKSVFAALSARVGSIGDNRLGGWYSYRASKAALNMLLKTLSIEQARQWPQAVIVGLHPGTVNTELSAPFTKRTAPEKLFSPEISAGHLLKVLDGLTPEDSGGVFAWDRRRIEN